MPVSYAVLSSRLAWLKASLGQKRNNIALLLGRLSGLGEPGAMKPSLFGKFLRMLEDVAAAHEEEWGLIAQIEAVEQKHRFMRVHKKLKPALPPRITQAENYLRKAPEQSFFEWLLWLVLWLAVLENMFPWGNEINQKKQGVTGLKPIFTPFPLP